MGNNRKLTIDRVRAVFDEIRWILTSTEIANSKQYVTGFCDQGHPISIRWNNFQQGVRCRICAGWVTPTIEEISDYVKGEGLTLISTEFVGQHEKLEIKCPDPSHPILKISWSDFKHEGVRCKYCLKADPVSERSEEEQRSIAITNRMRSTLCKYLDRPYPFVTATFCGKLALEIIETLGPRPSGMTIDHVVTPSWFDHNKQEQIDLCWSVGNLQWLLGSDNSKKSSSLTKAQMLRLTQYQVAIANLAEWRPIDHENMMRKLGLWMSKEDALMMLKTIRGDRMSA